MNISVPEILEIVSSVIKIDKSSLNPEMSFADAGVNSINFIEIVMDIERRTNQEFDDDRLSPIFFESIGEFARAIAEM